MNEEQCANRSGWGPICQRNPNHEGQHGYAGMFWDDPTAAERELERFKASVLELADAYRESANNRAFGEGCRDGCRGAAREFRALVEFWDVPQRTIRGLPSV